MKKEITRKEALRKYEEIVSFPYAVVQHLLALESRDHYTTGVYGWNCDIYNLQGMGQNLVISTGYRPIGIEVKGTRELAKEYNDRAREIDRYDYNTYEHYIEAMEENLNDFINAVSELISQ